MHASLGAVALPDDLLWTDEFATGTGPVAQSVQVSLTGQPLIQEAAKAQTSLGGFALRPITLVGDEAAGWATRAQVQALRELAASPATVHRLALYDGRIFNVVFGHGTDGSAVAASPLRAVADVQDAGDFYTLTLKLLAV